MTRNVLIVEDEWLIATDEAQTLSGAGYDIVGPCASVRAAMDAIDRNPVDAAFLDVTLREENSFAIAERLRKMGVPYHFVTGHDECSIPRSVSGGGKSLLKPTDPALLLAAAASMIDGAERQDRP